MSWLSKLTTPRVPRSDVKWWALGASAAGVGLLMLLSSRRASGAIMSPSIPAGGGGGYGQPPAAAYAYLEPVYPPRAPNTIALFTAAARSAGLPDAWASDSGLHNIIERESGGWVGRPNYQFGSTATDAGTRARWPAIWAALRLASTPGHVDDWRALLDGRDRAGVRFADKPRGEQSSATGIGQLTITNIKTGRFYPSGPAGVGVALEEAIGMLKYIKERYGDPATAWARYGKGQEGY